MRDAIKSVAVGLAGVVLLLFPGAVRAATQPKAYFLADSGRSLVPVTVGGTLRTPTAALAALAAGPNAAQRANGYESPFPSGTRAGGVNAAGSVATVALSGSPLLKLSTIPRLRLIASVTYTLTSFPAIRTVRFTLQGRPWGVYDHSGRVVRDYRRGTLAHPWLTACAPGDGCFTP